MLKIIVIDDHILLRDMIVDTLNNEKDFNVVGISNDAKDAPELCAKSNPDVLLMDICTANNSNGIAFAKIVKKNHPNISVRTLIGFKTNQGQDRGRDYFKITKREDYVAKMTIL